MSKNFLSKKLDEYRLRLNGREFVPLMIGGMGVDISSRGLALVAAGEGGIGHISDAMVPTIIDRNFGTRYVAEKLKRFKFNVGKSDKSIVRFDLKALREAQMRHVEETMAAKRGSGGIFINCMEKLTMNGPLETLRTRLNAALDAGIDGITLSAGLHLRSLELIKDNPRFREASIGIIVSSVRALGVFLRRAAKVARMPDFIVVEGPLAGGHLGFGMDWAKYNLKSIVREVLGYLREKGVAIPVIPAGGVFTGSDGVEYLEMGAAGVQVATRFTVTQQGGLPDEVKQRYFDAKEEDVVVNMISPTGYPMRMLRQSPAIGAGIRPNCESYGYLLDNKGHCDYIDAYDRAAAAAAPGARLSVVDKTCLCTHMRKFTVWTCGHYVYRLKDTTRRLKSGLYELLDAVQVFRDYQFSSRHEIRQAA